MNKQKQNKINKIISEYRLMAYNSKNPFIKKFCYEKAWNNGIGLWSILLVIGL